jgi:ice-binding like protein/Big-like domain-containing protein
VRALFASALACGLLFAGFGPPSAVAASTTTVNLGQASTYSVLSGASVGNTVSAPGAPHTTLRGDLGVKADSQPTGFPPGVVTGTTRVGSAADQAHADLVAAYNEVAARTGGDPLAGALAGMTISPGLHTIAAAASNTGTVTLDGGGNPNAVFVFQINGALAFAAGSHVVLTHGAQASRVFWQVNGAGSIGANADFAGTLMAHDAVGVGAGTLVNGRAFALGGALTLDDNQFYSASPAVTIAGGPSASTPDTTPTISGTTDVEAPGVVTVTIAGQTLTANVTPSDGAWSVTSAILANGTYPVVASVRDAAGNPASATQQLTVDTVLPVVTLDGGPFVTTNNPTTTISGTSDAAVDTVVRVAVDSQSLRALVHLGGTWNIRPTALTDGTHTVTASVTDPAGNVGTDSQNLIIDTIPPAVSVDGGASALTSDATPVISGTAAVAADTNVTVNLADQTLTGPVAGDGTWSVIADALADGPHRVVMSVSDAAGNPASATQTLTVDTVSPVITITGGATATTHDVTPTITGTSGAAPGTTVTVSIAGQTMTTLLQANHDWNVTPSSVAERNWQVVATVADPAGNMGSANQTLTVAADNPGDTTPPESTITARPRNKTANKRVTYRFASSEAGSSFECKIDKRKFQRCTSPTKLKLGKGFHKFAVRATDAAGNLDATAARDSFRIK